jgi:ribosomal protein L24E
MLNQRLFHTFLATFLILLVTTTAFAAPSFSSWGPAANLESVPGTSSELNTPYLDGCPILSRNGLQLYMASDRPGGLGGIDIWVAERASPDGPFGDPVNVGEPINSTDNDFCPSPLRDGHGFMFVSNRPGGCGGSDIYLTRYNPETGWQAPVNLGCDVNSAADEAGPVLVFADPESPTLYFFSAREEGPGGPDLYQSQMTGGWSFGPAELVPGVNSDSADIQPYVRRDGRELVFASDRSSGVGSFDIWSASREAITDPWSEPVNLGPNVNSAAGETRPSLSWDGTMLLFGTTRPGVEGVSDIFYATRDK